MDRRQFMKTAAGAAAAFGLGNLQGAEAPKTMIWGELLHLGQNMWGDTPRAYTPPVDKFCCEIPIWNELTETMASSGLNMIVIDLGEAVRYESHPELAVPGAWSVERLREELARLRKLGLEPIPKLNFSACHDFWLGDYARMVSTPKYYEVCADLVKEVCAIFDQPRFFHLGYDEENYDIQNTYDYVVVRQGELWWHDFLFFTDQVEKGGCRPWIWSDYYWHHPEDFLNRMPKSVLQSNWYYGAKFGEDISYVKAFIDLEKAGFDQVPAGSNYSTDENFEALVPFCRDHISPEHLLGFLQAPWKFTCGEDRDRLFRSVEQVKRAKEAF